MKKIFFAILFLSIALFSQTENKAGRKAPNFNLEDVDGNKIELKNEIGSGPVLISFWATWCKPCVEELAHFQKLFEDLKDTKFKMFGISIDSEKSMAKVKPYIKAKGFTFPVLLDPNSDVARDYYALNVPFSVLIDKNGSIVFSHSGYKKGDELLIKKKINELLN